MIAFDMPKTATEIAPPAVAGEDEEESDLLDVS